MKKIIMTGLAALFSLASFAQSDFGVFNHLAIGLNAGTAGAGIDLATPVGNHFQLRAGFTMLPVTVTEDLDLSGYYPADVASYYGGALHLPSEIDVEGKLKMNNAKILLDIFPSKHSSFHFTAGAYIGGSEVISLRNAKDGDLMVVNQANDYISQWNQQGLGQRYPLIGVELGDYFLTPDKQGNVKGAIKTTGLKPYVGIGFGRAVPKKAVSFMFELGAMIWGSPKIYCNDLELKPENVDGDEGEILRVLTNASVYPVVNFRLCFKAF